ncbi:hypothetical protein FOJ82_10305 [Tessaracoccus rhinocerotis]|uniref:Ribosomally synthesized peptide with SipW-like signal peptide n=1 Tax=Tessaracoccus rhinocerotis TaxID=1689449 RepID=A0A553JYZ1_9ACTN|nr:hypothetical protein [Tessaracoccus rhinocerotis]TRY17672.1 hypothetical protein FOJ82_10305 [Tessaracoccus rhinocerotis]
MKPRTVLRVAAAMVAALAVGAFSVRVTWALWNVAVSSGAQSVRAADFQINVNGSPTIIDGSEVTVSLGAAGPLVPGATVHQAVNVTVPTTASADFTVAATLGAPQVVDASVASLPEYLEALVGVAPASGLCEDVAVWSDSATAEIAKGGAAGFCLRVTMLAGAPRDLQGATGSIKMPVTVRQV